MNYYKRNWNETTGDDLTDHWGTSTWYFEVGEDHYITRQLEIFENGNVLKYDESFLDDEYGGLGDQPLEEEDFISFRIEKEEFEAAWKKTAVNR